MKSLALPISASTGDVSGQNTKRKTRGKAKEYTEILKFSDFKTAENAMTGIVAGQMWIKKYVRQNKDCQKIYFACKSNANCPKSLYILRNVNFNETSVWLCSSADHQHKKTSKGPLPSKTVDFIKKLLDNGLSAFYYCISGEAKFNSLLLLI
jgi:hypothetical protein